jgi:hypothetical protein
MLTRMEPFQSQLDPLPRDLPFRIISKTIGRGAYASYVWSHFLESISIIILLIHLQN